MNELRLPFYARIAFILITVVLIIFLLSEGSSIFIPLFFACLISALLLPLTRRLEKLGLGKGPSALIAVLLFIGCLALFVYFLSLQIINFSRNLPEFQSRIQSQISLLQQWIETNYGVNSSEQVVYLNKSATGMFNTIANSISNIFLSLLTFTIYTVFVFVYTFFMLSHKQLLLRFISGLFRSGHQEQVHAVVNDVRVMINHYVLGLLTEMTILMVMNSAVFALLGIKYALLLGVISAVLNIIPYLGIYTAMVISMTVTFANGTPNQAIWVGLSLLIIHFVDVNVLLPRIVGGRVEMNPLITIIAVITGGLIWGVAGMFLFIPLVAILKIIFERVKGLQPWAILIGSDDNL